MYREQHQTQAGKNVGCMKALSIMQLICGILVIGFCVRKCLFHCKLRSSNKQTKLASIVVCFLPLVIDDNPGYKS